MIAPNKAMLKCELVDDDTEYVRHYFDLETNYAEIKKKVSTNDTNMKEAIKYGYGIRILNQDPWEMLISYIISAANIDIISMICKLFGFASLADGLALGKRNILIIFATSIKTGGCYDIRNCKTDCNRTR